MLAEELFNANISTFLLTYKLSQDHLETFFSVIRRMNGWNNNPTAKLFKYSYRKLLYVANISVSLSANCIPRDDTLLLTLSNESTSDIQVTNNNIIQQDNINSDNPFFDTMEHNYFRNNNNYLSEYTQEIIAYMSGYVAKNVIKKINCSICKSLLVSHESQSDTYCSNKLLQRKRRGTLLEASDDVITVYKIAHTVFKCNKTKLYTTKNIISYLICQTTHLLPSSIFDYKDHIFDQSPLYDHRNQVIKLLLETYFISNIKHHSKSFVENHSGQRIRMKNNKITLFKNQ